jgi:hypothetical protein
MSLSQQISYLVDSDFPAEVVFITSRSNAVGIATGFELDDQVVGVRVPVGSRIVTSPYRSDRRWGPLTSN